MQSIRLSGGEPTLRLDLIDIIKYCLDLKLEVILCSNLFNIEYFFHDLVRLPIPITTSVHGDEHIHNAITGIQSYQNTVNNIKKLVQNDMNVNVHFVVTKINYHYLNDIVEDSIRWGVKKVSFLTFIPRERGEHYRSNFELSLADIEQLSIKTEQYSHKYGESIKIKIDNFHEKYYYVFELDGNLYLQKTREEDDELIERII
jgi:MoaA/NifB/PqqE/SkfB family radical SAM enzyme